MSAVRFLGCSLVRFSSNVGWGESPSTVSITLVEDTKNGDRFILENSPDVGVGSPYTFTFGNYTFRGILQSWRKKNGSDGNPLYELSLADPRDVLTGTQIVTSSYYATTSQTPNILNPFGYYENQAFGSSFSNEGGMPWRTLYPMVTAMANDTIEFKTFGSKLRYKNNTYKLDISELETAPFHYRIRGTPSVSLMDMINQRCTDAGLDYVIDLLEDNTIRVRTISRRNQIASNNGPNSGSINRYLESRTQVANKSRGWELRNDGPTSKMVVGANISELYQTYGTDVYPYWGQDPNGNLLLSNDLEDATQVTINSLCCVDFMGPLYTCSVAEIRLAMIGQQAWINYIAMQREDIAVRLGLESGYERNLLREMVLGTNSGTEIQQIPPSMLHTITPELAKHLASAKQAENAYNNASRLHRLISNAGQQHYGKTFVVFLPMILQKVDLETQTVTNSHDIDQEGGYTDGLTPPLGLSELNQLGFEKSMNRLQPFAFFDSSNIDPLTSSSSSSVLQTNGAYVKAQVDSFIYFTPFPAVIMSLSQPIMKKATYPHLLPDYLDNVVKPIGSNNITIDPQLSLFMSSNLVPTAGQSIVPKHLMPTAVAIPIRNNIFTYGPWWLNGAVAHSEFEKDDNLAPWNYGGIASMNLAAYNKLFASATNLITSESGEFEEAGAPQFSLGDLLLAEGSNITGIDVNIGQGGALTQYRLRTFDFRYIGANSKKQEERLARIGKGINTLRQRVREGYQKFYDNVVVVHQAYLEGCHPALNPKTPHTILYGCEYNFSDQTGYAECGTMTPGDAMTLLDPRPAAADKFKRTAIMSTNGLIRPFSTRYLDDYLPCFVRPKDGANSTDTANSKSLNPFKYKNDIMVYATGLGFNSNMKTIDYSFNDKKLDYSRQTTDAIDVRGMAMRGPVIIVGYGFNTYCKSAVDTFRKNGDWESARGTLDENDRSDVKGWRAGPVDLLWDEGRGVWTANTLTFGIPQATIVSKGTGKVDILGVDDTIVDTVNVYNPWARSIEAGLLIAFGYVAHKNKMCVIAANC